MKDIAILLFEASTLMRRCFEQMARPEGVTLMQWRVLRLLESHGPLRQVEVVEATGASPMTISDVAERLESAGFVTRNPDPEDSRAKSLALTETGAAKVAVLRSRSDAFFAGAFADIAPEELDALRRGLRNIRDNLAGSGSPACKGTDK
ncbi:MarR family winged helix-turn-helix transcriptional regulator [Tropicimonas sp.]|uniref:MarR family winged helix-turn-helix transcriptional regulator n=1 Tax=Tropicimonas sp. TaxID=2067044 RepID=UPI003A89F03D